MKATEIEGAKFILAHPDSWGRLSAAASPDKARLVLIYEVFGGFRVLRYVRGTMQPQFHGEWWLPHSEPSITDTLLNAKQLASEFLQSAL